MRGVSEGGVAGQDARFFATRRLHAVGLNLSKKAPLISLFLFPFAPSFSASRNCSRGYVPLSLVFQFLLQDFPLGMGWGAEGWGAEARIMGRQRWQELRSQGLSDRENGAD